MTSPSSKPPLLIFGDTIIFYVSLFCTLLVRYRRFDLEQISIHLAPFSIAFLAWLLIAYIGGLYDVKLLKNTAEFSKTFVTLLIIQAALMIALFYFLPAFGIAPKVNLFIFLAIFALLALLWRTLFNTVVAAGTKNRLAITGDNKTTAELTNYIKNNQQLGYEIGLQLTNSEMQLTAEELINRVAANQINTIIVSGSAQKNKAFRALAYPSLTRGIQTMRLSDLYEIIFKKISLEELEDSGFLESILREHHSYRIISRFGEIICALAIGIITLPISLLTIVLIRLTSAGPAIYAQKRVGAHGKVFSLYKFRSMYATKDKNPDADATAPVWSTAADNRITPLGRFLRFSHIDEIPQLLNIIAGQMSFIGPRPERPEIDEGLKKRIPYYELRYFTKPGITGWAQINYRYVASVDDAYERVQYDMYYLKNRSFLLDFGILMKTVKKIFVQEK